MKSGMHVMNKTIFDQCVYIRKYKDTRTSNLIFISEVPKKEISTQLTDHPDKKLNFLFPEHRDVENYKNRNALQKSIKQRIRPILTKDENFKQTQHRDHSKNKNPCRIHKGKSTWQAKLRDIPFFSRSLYDLQP